MEEDPIEGHEDDDDVHDDEEEDETTNKKSLDPSTDHENNTLNTIRDSTHDTLGDDVDDDDIDWCGAGCRCEDTYDDEDNVEVDGKAASKKGKKVRRLNRTLMHFHILSHTFTHSLPASITN